MHKSPSVALFLLAVALGSSPQSSVANISMLECIAAKDWKANLEAVVRRATDVERLSLALTSRPGCSKVATRGSYVCSWDVEERLFAEADLVGVTSAAVVCIVDSRGMIGQTPPERERAEASSTCSIRFEFRPEPEGPCGGEG